MRHEIWRSAFSCGSSGAVDDMVLFVRSVAAACNKDTFESEVSSEYTGGIDFLGCKAIAAVVCVWKGVGESGMGILWAHGNC